MTSTNPIRVLREEISAALQFVAPLVEHKREQYTNAAPPRYVWVPVGGPWEGARMPARSPRPLARVPFRVDVDCWGVDGDGACDLVRAFATVLESVCQGRNFRITGLLVVQPAWATCGEVWRLTVQFDVAMLEAALLTSPYETISDAEETRVIPETFEQDTPALSVSGDGMLEGTES